MQLRGGRIFTVGHRERGVSNCRVAGMIYGIPRTDRYIDRGSCISSDFIIISTDPRQGALARARNISRCGIKIFNIIKIVVFFSA